MKYLTDKQLEKEVLRPLVTDPETDSISKFIKNYAQDKNDYHNGNDWYVEPQRLLVTKFIDYDSMNTFK